MDSEFDNIPDLEDCSNLLNTKFARKSHADNSGDIKIETISSEFVAPATQIDRYPHSINDTLIAENSGAGFCGLRKGFLNGTPRDKKHHTSPSIKTDTLPFIKRNPVNDQQNLLLKEVQQTLIEKKAEWLTDDLVRTIQGSDDDVLSMLSNQEFAAVLDEFQKNPKQAMAKYQNNLKIMNFFTKFAKIMGEHFTKLGSKQM